MSVDCSPYKATVKPRQSQEIFFGYPYKEYPAILFVGVYNDFQLGHNEKANSMTLNIQKFNSIVEAAKAKAAGDAKWMSAIDRAAQGILSGELIVTTLAHGALVTTPRGTYAANGHCNCEAARRGHTQCYHRAAARLMALYETATEAVSLAEDVAASPRQNLIIEINNIWSRTQTTPLAVELMARFGKNKLEMLDDDSLRRVRLAIAM